MTRFTLYGSPHSLPTYKVALVLQMSGEPFVFRYVSFQKGVHKTPEFRSLSRWGQVPVLLDNGHTRLQATAIVEHLAETLGQFQGNEEPPANSSANGCTGRSTSCFRLSSTAMAFSLASRSCCPSASSQLLLIIMAGAPKPRYRCWTPTSPSGTSLFRRAHDRRPRLPL